MKKVSVSKPSLRRTSTPHVSSTPKGQKWEDILVPFVPRTVEGLAIFLFAFSFLLTVPMGFTRVIKKRWIGQVEVQMFIPNMIAKMFGRKPFFEGDNDYLPYAREDEDPSRPHIDLAFWLHLICGLSWLTIGAIQIGMHRSWVKYFYPKLKNSPALAEAKNNKIHRRFGWVATAVFLSHIAAAAHTLYRDIVHHHTLAKLILWSDLATSSYYIIGGIMERRRGNLETHKDMMMYGFLHAIEGSGTIRFTGWILWVIGKILNNEASYWIDTTACQRRNDPFMAAATNCVFPYVFRLSSLRLVTLYFKLLYLRTAMKERAVTARKMLNEEKNSHVQFAIGTLIVIVILVQVRETAGFYYMMDNFPWIQMVAITFYCFYSVYLRTQALNVAIFYDAVKADRDRRAVYNNLMGTYFQSNVFDKYEKMELLAEGSVGPFYKVRFKGGLGVADKFIPLLGREQVLRTENVYTLRTIDLTRVPHESRPKLSEICKILGTTDHPHIIKEHDLFFHSNQINVLQEFFSGGDLYSGLYYSEAEAARIVLELLRAVRYLHDREMVHKNLLFETVYFESKEPGAAIKVNQFSIAYDLLSHADPDGQIYATAPEVLENKHNASFPSDVWSVGVIAFMLLSATKPFRELTKKLERERILNGSFNFQAEIWPSISKDAKNFVTALLEKDPSKRPTAAGALEHPWIANRAQWSNKKPSEDVVKEIAGNLIKYKTTSHIKKFALQVMAKKISAAEVVELRKFFEEYDVKKDGVLSMEEFHNAMKHLNLPEEEIKELFNQIDVGDDGLITYTEFLAATLEAHGHVTEGRIAETFNRLDHDGSGFITRRNLGSFLGKEMLSADIDLLLEEADENHDGKISCDEFVTAIRKQTEMAVEDISQSPKAKRSSSGRRLSVEFFDTYTVDEKMVEDHAEEPPRLMVRSFDGSRNE